ncbi:hypothetical protein ATI61_113240 [Archangium gephyra]|uniref:Lipoprotein n=1 Tax=Archangium gephyra TaxID=48 RepID=A0AAC8Q8I6_9BACT|nr:hypothetical protein [Archangium gephyra]AKJ03052.1 putative lipoprotein [Archangium gephyra]REG25176.1 hypothetical protein ATI61_113240 [Archangium gephyra]
MRILLNALVLACALAASGCFLAENAGPGHPCSDDSECPASYRCVTVSADQRSCEVVYPPAPLETDAGSVDAGPVPTWCQDIRPIMAASCVASCHGADTSGSKRTDFRLDQYAAIGGVNGARDLAARIKARAVDTQTMPPPGNPAPSATERELLRRWIAGGTPLCADGGT